MRKKQEEGRGSIMTALRELLFNNAYTVCYKITNGSFLKPVCFIPAYGKDNCDLIAKLPEN